MSKIKFTCYYCNAKLEIDAEYIGRKGKCPKCETRNTVPSPEDTLEDSIMILFKDIEDKEDEENKDNKEYEPYSKDSYTDDDGGNLPNG